MAPSCFPANNSPSMMPSVSKWSVMKENYPSRNTCSRKNQASPSSSERNTGAITTPPIFFWISTFLRLEKSSTKTRIAIGIRRRTEASIRLLLPDASPNMSNRAPAPYGPKSFSLPIPNSSNPNSVARCTNCASFACAIANPTPVRSRKMPAISSNTCSPWPTHPPSKSVNCPSNSGDDTCLIPSLPLSDTFTVFDKTVC